MDDNQPSGDDDNQPSGGDNREPAPDVQPVAGQSAVTSRTWMGLSHRRWKVLGALAAIVVAVAGVGVAIAEFRKTNEARVELVDFAVQKPSAVAAEVFDISDASGPRTAGTAEATVIDVTLKNSGDAPAVLLAADFKVLFAEQLDSCSRTGGPAVISAEYAVKVPAYPPAIPFVVRRDMRFALEPGHVDRFAFSIGPEQQAVSTSVPWLYVVDILLWHDESKEPVRLGTAATVARSGDGIRNVDDAETNPDCVPRNSRLTAEFGKIEALRSEEASTLIERYRNLRRNAGLGD